MFNAGRGAVAIVVSPFEKLPQVLGVQPGQEIWEARFVANFAPRKCGSQERSFADAFTALLKNTVFADMYSDIFALMRFSIFPVSQSVAFFRRQI
jgi:hypothetical protein